MINQLKKPIDASHQPFIKLARQSSLIKNNPDAYNSLIEKDLKLSLQNHIAEYEYANTSLLFYNTQIDKYLTPLRIKHYPNMPNYREVESVEEFSFICKDIESLAIIELMKQKANSSIRNVNRFLTSNYKLSNLLKQFIKDSSN
jgi:hypothetical protein